MHNFWRWECKREYFPFSRDCALKQIENNFPHPSCSCQEMRLSWCICIWHIAIRAEVTLKVLTGLWYILDCHKHVIPTPAVLPGAGRCCTAGYRDLSATHRCSMNQQIFQGCSFYLAPSSWPPPCPYHCNANSVWCIQRRLSWEEKAWNPPDYLTQHICTCISEKKLSAHSVSSGLFCTTLRCLLVCQL